MEKEYLSTIQELQLEVRRLQNQFHDAQLQNFGLRTDIPKTKVSEKINSIQLCLGLQNNNSKAIYGESSTEDWTNELMALDDILLAVQKKMKDIQEPKEITKQQDTKNQIATPVIDTIPKNNIQFINNNRPNSSNLSKQQLLRPITPKSIKPIIAIYTPFRKTMTVNDLSVLKEKIIQEEKRVEIKQQHSSVPIVNKSSSRVSTPIVEEKDEPTYYECRIVDNIFSKWKPIPQLASINEEDVNFKQNENSEQESSTQKDVYSILSSNTDDNHVSKHIDRIPDHVLPPLHLPVIASRPNTSTTTNRKIQFGNKIMMSVTTPQTEKPRDKKAATSIYKPFLMDRIMKD